MLHMAYRKAAASWTRPSRCHHEVLPLLLPSEKMPSPTAIRVPPPTASPAPLLPSLWTSVRHPVTFSPPRTRPRLVHASPHRVKTTTTHHPLRAYQPHCLLLLSPAPHFTPYKSLLKPSIQNRI